MMKNKFKHNEIKAGLLVAVNTQDDGNVYTVLHPHSDNEFVFLLAQEQNDEIVTCGYSDFCYFFKPSKEQMVHPDNQWVKKYQSN